MSFAVNEKGFAKLDFDEMKKIAAMTGFDITTHASANKRRSCACGPGGKYLTQDKRFFTPLLIKHIEEMKQSQPDKITQEALDWLDKAREAACEYTEIERKMHHQLTKNT